eukprot:4379149-Prymnesium_polylepis.1
MGTWWQRRIEVFIGKGGAAGGSPEAHVLLLAARAHEEEVGAANVVAQSLVGDHAAGHGLTQAHH